MTTFILQQKRQGHSLLETLGAVSCKLQRMLDKHHQRRQLLRLDDRLLRDVGLDHEQVKMEVSKPFWQ